MKIVCDSCGAKYSIADEKVAGKIFKIRCKKCSSVLEVRGDQTSANAVNEQIATPDRGGEATWYIVVDGEQQGPLAPIELSQLFAKGSVNLESYVWNEGFDDWRVASDVPEVAQLFGGAASQAKPQAAGDDTMAFGAGGDLFSSNDGREPTSEIDTNSSMFAGFDENPTPTPAGAESSPMAAASNDAAASLAGGAMGGAAPQRMTGQRNENSVLFSLSNLQQLASRGGSPAESPAMASQPPSASLGAQSAPPPSGEGSGLIDIRAFAKSTTPGTRAAPSQAVDDLLAIGTGGGAAFGAPLLGPAPDETAYGSRWLWIGGVAIAIIAIVGAAVGVGMALGGSEEDALEITAETERRTRRCDSGRQCGGSVCAGAHRAFGQSARGRRGRRADPGGDDRGQRTGARTRAAGARAQEAQREQHAATRANGQEHDERGTGPGSGSQETQRQPRRAHGRSRGRLFFDEEAKANQRLLQPRKL